MGYFSSIRHSDKTPDKADRIKAILDKGVPKPKHFDTPKAKHKALKAKTGKSAQSRTDDKLKEDFVNKILRGH